MSAETLSWLNTNTLVGFVGKRGKAWHFSADLQGVESNHFDGPIPVGDVIRRLFSWDLVTHQVCKLVPVDASDPEALFSPGVIVHSDGLPYRVVAVDGSKAVGRSDDAGAATFGIFKDGWQAHQYPTWLIDNVAKLLDTGIGDVGIGSAGLLRGGAVAWVQIETPDGVEIGGDLHRPFLCAFTSSDGSMATSYKPGMGRVVCDNTLASFRREAGRAWKAKHSSKSIGRIDEARAMLEIAFTSHDEMAGDIARLQGEVVTAGQFSRFVGVVAPMAGKEGKALTLATNKAEQIISLYHSDPRVAPYNGTAWGALQAANTWAQHLQTVRNIERAERNRLDFLAGSKSVKPGQAPTSDLDVLDALATIVGRELVSV